MISKNGIVIGLLLFCSSMRAQDISRFVTIHPLVGTVIDSTEKVKYHLFPYWKKENFKQASFYRQADSSVVLVGTMKNDSTIQLSFSKQDLKNTTITINAWAGNYHTATFTWFDVIIMVGTGIVDWRENKSCLKND
ncbi:MAG: hypothetical protein ACHQF2_05045 [Flavobacteriales bacterium]